MTRLLLTKCSFLNLEHGRKSLAHETCTTHVYDRSSWAGIYADQQPWGIHTRINEDMRHVHSDTSGVQITRSRYRQHIPTEGPIGREKTPPRSADSYVCSRRLEDVLRPCEMKKHADMLTKQAAAPLFQLRHQPWPTISCNTCAHSRAALQILFRIRSNIVLCTLRDSCCLRRCHTRTAGVNT